MNGNNIAKKVATLALAGGILVASGCAANHAQAMKSSNMGMNACKAMHSCKGQNACKGANACKSSNGCSGSGKCGH